MRPNYQPPPDWEPRDYAALTPVAKPRMPYDSKESPEAALAYVAGEIGMTGLKYHANMARRDEEVVMLINGSPGEYVVVLRDEKFRLQFEQLKQKEESKRYGDSTIDSHAA